MILTLTYVKIIDRCSQWAKRLVLEAWHSIREPNAILMTTFIFLRFTRPLAIPSDVSAALLRHSFEFVSHFMLMKVIVFKPKLFTQNDYIFFLNESSQINLYKAKTKVFYNLFINLKIHTEVQTGPKRWSENFL